MLWPEMVILFLNPISEATDNQRDSLKAPIIPLPIQLMILMRSLL